MSIQQQLYPVINTKLKKQKQKKNILEKSRKKKLKKKVLQFCTKSLKYEKKIYKFLKQNTQKKQSCQCQLVVMGGWILFLTVFLSFGFQKCRVHLRMKSGGFVIKAWVKRVGRGWGN